MLTQAYTPSIVEQVHRSIVNDIAMTNKRADVRATAVPAACALHHGLMTGIEEMEEPTAVAAAPCLALELAQVCANALRPAFNTVIGHVIR